MAVDMTATEEVGESYGDEAFLPVDWEMRTATNGRVYFANHKLKTTQWNHPITGRQLRAKEVLDYQENVCNENVSQNQYSASSTAMHVLQGCKLKGRVIVITGGNSGIGFETARALVYHGAHVIIACRSMRKAEDAVLKIIKECQQKDIVAVIEPMLLNLASFRSVRSFAESFKNRKLPLHVLICNAGILSSAWNTTEDHIEQTFAINYLGHFLLIQQLQDVLISSSPARIVMISSESHRFLDFNYSSKLQLSAVPLSKNRYWSILAYNQSKLCCLLLSMEINRRYFSSGVTCNAVHPGNLIYTSLYKSTWLYWALFWFARPFNKTASQGAATVVFCAVAQELEGVGGLYLNNCQQCEPSAEAMDRDKAKALWDKSINMICGIPWDGIYGTLEV